MAKQTVEVSVSREELDVVSDWLRVITEGGDAEAEGRKSDDNRAAQAAELLADYAEQNGERGADVISVCRGVPVLVEVVLEAESQRMMEALMGACAGVIPPRKVGALRILVSMAKCERHRAGISGSGVLGIVTAAAVGVRTPTKLRALCFEAIGVWACDDDVESSTRFFDEKRAEEFMKLRKQVLAVKVLDAMSTCLEPSKAPNKVALCTAASDAIGRLAPSVDICEVLVRTQVVNKCLIMLQSAHKAMSEVEEGNSEDIEEDFDYCFAWERPALRVIVGVLRHLSTLPLTTKVQTSDNGSSSSSNNDTVNSLKVPLLCQQVATKEMVDAVLNVLSIGGGGRGEVERLALDVLRRLSHLELCQSGSKDDDSSTITLNNPGTIKKTGVAEVASGERRSACGGGGGDTDAEIASSPNIITGAAYLLGDSKRGVELMSSIRRILVMSDEYTMIVSLELLSKLVSIPCFEATCKLWRSAVLQGGGLLPPIARAIIASRIEINEETSPSLDINAANGVRGGGVGSASPPGLSATTFSTVAQHARPLSVLMAAALLFRACSFTNDVEGAGSAVYRLKRQVPGSMVEAAQCYLDCLVLLSTDSNILVRTDAVSSLITILHPTAQHLSVYGVFMTHIRRCCDSLGSITTPEINTETHSSKLNSEFDKASKNPTCMIGAALRTIAVSGDLSVSTREIANELIDLIDMSFSTVFNTSPASSSTTSKSKQSKKNKKNKNKHISSSNNTFGAAAVSASGGLGEISESRISLRQSLQCEIDAYVSSVSLDVRKENVLSLPNKLKQCGNEKFKARLFVDATLYYEKVLSCIDDIEKEEEEVEGSGEDEDEEGEEGDMEGVDHFEDFDKLLKGEEGNKIAVSSPSLSHENKSTLGVKSQLDEEIGALKVACYLNQARCYVKILQEDKCLAACAYAEASTSNEAERVKVTLVCCFLKAQLWWQLSGCATADSGHVQNGNAKRKHYLCRARDVLSRSRHDKSSRQLLKSVNNALKSVTN